MLMAAPFALRHGPCGLHRCPLSINGEPFSPYRRTRTTLAKWAACARSFQCAVASTDGFSIPAGTLAQPVLNLSMGMYRGPDIQEVVPACHESGTSVDSK